MKWFSRGGFEEGASGLWKEPGNCFKHRSVKDLFNKGLSMIELWLPAGQSAAVQRAYKMIVSFPTFRMKGLGLLFLI